MVSTEYAPDYTRRQWRLTLAALMAAAFGLRVLTWWLFPNTHHGDEIFQYQEQAFRLVKGYGVIPWEFIEGTRSWYLPGLLAGLLWLAEALPGGISWWPALMAITLSFLSLSVVWVMASYGRWFWGLRGAVLAGGFAVVWYEFLLFAPKTLTGVISTHLMLLALLAWGLGLKRVARNRLILGGVLMGTALVVRPQLALGLAALAVGIIWFHGRNRSLVPVLLGVGGAVIAFGLIDLLAFDYPYQWAVQNVRFNIIENVTGEFGAQPWYFYPGMLFLVWLYLAPVLFALFLIAVRKLPLLGAAATVIVLSHTLITHKEYRFIYAAVILALIVCAVGAVQVAARLSERRALSSRGKWVLVAGVIGLVGVAGLARSLHPPLYDEYWRQFSDRTAAFEVLKNDPALGSIVLDVKWGSTPGYSGLQRDVPMHALTEDEDLRDLVGTYTHLLTFRDPEDIPGDHEALGQWRADEGTLVLYRYLGEQVGPPPPSLSEQNRRYWTLFRAGLSDRLDPHKDVVD
jgi:hypothetical protein